MNENDVVGRAECDEMEIRLWAFKGADEKPGVRFLIPGGSDVELPDDAARRVAQRLWTAGEAATKGAEGHAIAFQVVGPGVVDVPNDFGAFGVEAFRTVDGKPCVRFLVRGSVHVDMHALAAGKLASRFLKAAIVAGALDSLDPPKPIEFQEGDLQLAEIWFANMAGEAGRAADPPSGS